MRVEAAGTSVSWIPSEAVSGPMKATFATGLSHYDQPPPGELGDAAAMRATLEDLRDRDAFRFANFLHAWAEFDGDRVVAHGSDGGIVMGATTVRVGKLGATFQAVKLPDLKPEPEIGPGWVKFTQTAGGRTALPLPRPIRRPPFFRLQAPLVWTTLTLTLRADGTSEIGMEGASPFPRHWVYGTDGDVTLKAGVADWSNWLGQPSWKRTPWGDEDSPVLVTAAETALERELSTLLMHGAAKPTVRTLAEGEVLAERGEPGSSLYLILDGVLGVEVNGEALGELGPGAVLGERAVLEEGIRTATLTAVTPVRVAEAPGSDIDRAALARLAEGHRREEQSA
ncbi:cyclic nucleotide-binding domain-containing protein [Spongisporangium articulatum]|uniref:Cyclic nucleotide-binding domain-containing protein n=1 Tax=Spongisporangium articulatum TaxID=3362603 RepID=A0ABW8AIJ6_9ACTN